MIQERLNEVHFDSLAQIDIISVESFLLLIGILIAILVIIVVVVVVL